MELDTKQPHVTAICPFCKGQYIAGFTTDNDGFILHTLPECTQFLAFEVCDFLEAARKAGAIAIKDHPIGELKFRIIPKNGDN